VCGGGGGCFKCICMLGLWQHVVWEVSNIGVELLGPRAAFARVVACFGGGGSRHSRACPEALVCWCCGCVKLAAASAGILMPFVDCGLGWVGYVEIAGYVLAAAAVCMAAAVSIVMFTG
jgi:hypothetical protein